jgi:hypothetical protein
MVGGVNSGITGTSPADPGAQRIAMFKAAKAATKTDATKASITTALKRLYRQANGSAPERAQALEATFVIGPYKDTVTLKLFKEKDKASGKEFTCLDGTLAKHSGATSNAYVVFSTTEADVIKALTSDKTITEVQQFLEQSTDSLYRDFK